MESFIAKHKNEEVRASSRSGGIFTALSNYVLENNGVVYGVAMDENLNVIHKRAETKSERDCFRGSKYVRSEIIGIMTSIKEDLSDGRLVLFSGTPCQVVAIKKQCENIATGKLICIDIVCHGVPKPEAWKKYQKYLELKYQGKIENVNFRNKIRFGWKSHVETYVINGKEYASREYTDLFYKHLLFEKGCFFCKFKSLSRKSDITLADAWGKCEEAFNDNKGVSLVLLNTETGKELFQKCSTDIIFLPCDITDYMQSPLKENYPIPKEYDEFWSDMNRMEWKQLYSKYCEVPLYKRILRKLKYAINR